MQSLMICPTPAGFFTPPKGMTNKHIRMRIRHAYDALPFCSVPLSRCFLENQEELIQTEIVPEQSEMIHRAQRHLRDSTSECGLLDRSFINVSGYALS